jgi:hypothetical protein
MVIKFRSKPSLPVPFRPFRSIPPSFLVCLSSKAFSVKPSDDSHGTNRRFVRGNVTLDFRESRLLQKRGNGDLRGSPLPSVDDIFLVQLRRVVGKKPLDLVDWAKKRLLINFLAPACPYFDRQRVDCLAHEPHRTDSQ